ncbi:MAG: cardiolipin synthase [Clostridiaceae bacterium]
MFLQLNNISLIYIIYAIISITIIIIEKRQPEKTIAWLLIFLAFPPLGLFFYVFLGRNWKLNKLNDSYSNELKELVYNALYETKTVEYRPLIELLAKNSESPLFIDNNVDIFYNGEDKFKALKRELLKAKHHIHMEYYIVNNDRIGNEIKDILIQKASEGVYVRFIIDKVGSIKLNKNYINELKQAGIDVVSYSYFLAPLLRYINTQINYRNHRKIVVIDGLVGFIGGINIGDEYLGRKKYGFWRDTHLMIKGDFVLGLQSVFLDDYLTIKSANKEVLFYDRDFRPYFPKTTYENSKGQVLQLVKSGPDSNYPSILQGVLKMINLAKDHVYITTPYFVPPNSIMEALKIAALGGIDVKILFPEQSDHLTVHLASETYFQEIIKCGVEIYYYDKKAFVHSKVITVDGKIGTVGTANMDIRSYYQNYEINAVLYDKNLVSSLEAEFKKDLENSRLITSAYFDELPFYKKIAQDLARVFSYLL